MGMLAVPPGGRSVADPLPRSILAIDIEGSTQRTNPERGEFRRIMYALLDRALRATGIGHGHLEPPADRGDGVLILIRPDDDVPKTLLLGRLIPKLAALLAEHNATVAQPTLRLRVVFHAGEVHDDGWGFYGEDLDVAFRLLNSPTVKRALKDTPSSPLVLVVSEEIRSAIVRLGYIDVGPQVRSVEVSVARRRRRGWVHIPIPGTVSSPWLSAMGAVKDESSATAPDIGSAGQRNHAIAPGQHDSIDSVSKVEWAACYQAEMPYLIRYLLKCFGSADIDDAADAAHSAFLELLTKWDNVRNVRAWLRTVAFREMLRQPARGGYPLDSLPSQLVVSSASEQLELREQEQTVMAALRKLPLTQRQVLALIYDQFSYREIAEIMNISEAAVRKNAERARARLKEILGLS
jgi:RNA polymerase sigma factor (sigma-70 family)